LLLLRSSSSPPFSLTPLRISNPELTAGGASSIKLDDVDSGYSLEEESTVAEASETLMASMTFCPFQDLSQ
jgi:hypothetical protein